MVSLLGPGVAEEGDVEGRAISAAALDPDSTAVGFGDLLDDGEANPAARSPIARRPEALECLEHLLVMLGIDSTAGVADRDATLPSSLSDRNGDARLLAGPHVVDRISDQIRKDLIEPDAIAIDERGIMRKLEFDAGGVEPRLEFRLQLVEHGCRIDQRLSLARLADARKLQQVVDQIFHRSTGLLDPIDEMRSRVIEQSPVVLAQQSGKSQ